MSRIIKFLAIALFACAMTPAYAQNSSKAEKTINDIVARYDGTQGVECMSVVKGSGLELIKMTLNKEFGKSFMKGVTSITIIDYSEASQETCTSLRKDLDVFLSVLQEFDLSEEESFSKNEYLRCFSAVSDSGTLSDFVIAVEDDKTKMLMYMAGTIQVEQ